MNTVQYHYFGNIWRENSIFSWLMDVFKGDVAPVDFKMLLGFPWIPGF